MNLSEVSANISTKGWLEETEKYEMKKVHAVCVKDGMSLCLVLSETKSERMRALTWEIERVWAVCVLRVRKYCVYMCEVENTLCLACVCEMKCSVCVGVRGRKRRAGSEAPLMNGLPVIAALHAGISTTGCSCRCCLYCTKIAGVSLG